MKNKWMKIGILAGVLVLVIIGIVIGINFAGGKMSIAIDGELKENDVVEYTNEAIQFPMAHVENGLGQIVSYDVKYQVINTEDKSTIDDDYAMFDLKPGSYELHYVAKDNKKVSKIVKFKIQDTQKPTITFSDVPNGIFLQDLDKDEPNKLPLYDIEDASKDDGIELTRTLLFKGEKDTDFVETTYRDMNNSYEIKEFGQFKYVLTAKDKYGNSATEEVTWKIKDRNWKPDEKLKSGYLADYSTEGYTNYIEGGDANQYYQIGSDYSDQWLSEYEGAKGVLKIDMGFNNSAGYGNNTIRLRFANSFTKEDIEGKYLAVRLRVEGENISDGLLFAGNNVEFRKEDSTTRAFSTSVSGLEVGKWKTYYIDADTVEHIGVYSEAKYNSETTFYEGGKPATSIQLCFSRIAGHYNDMTLYVDSITLAEKLPDTEVTISGKNAEWTKVDGAAGYKINLNDKESTVKDTKISIEGNKGFVRVTPLGDGALTLDGEESTGVYGLDCGNKLAVFDDELYMNLISDKLKFSTENEHEGYKPNSLEGKLTQNGLKVDIGTGAWGVVTGIRMLFPNAQEKGNNTTLILNMNVSNAKYGQLRVYDYDGQLLQNITLDDKNTGKMNKFEIDISSYDKVLKGIQLIFGPKDMQTVSDGVSVEFKEIYMANTYTNIKINGKNYSCAGERVFTPGYTAADLVQFTSVYNFGVKKDDTPLSFSGVILLDGKKINPSTISIVGYPNTDTICFKIPHKGKVLTIKQGGYIYYGNVAVKVAENFNMKWDGTEWKTVSAIPATPKTEYITIAGKKYELVNKLELVPLYTTSDLVQFSNVNDFGVKADDTPLGFKGVVMVGGEKVNNPQFVGYKNNTTVCLKTPHNGKVVTIMKDSVIYYGKQAVKVTKTFNMKWNGTEWTEVSKIPEVPKDTYETIDGKKYKIVAKVELETWFTLDSLVQFKNINDFGVKEDDTILGFKGTVMVGGEKVNNPQVVGYKNSTTVCFKVPHNGKVLTILKGATIYYGDQAVKVTKTFNMKWNGRTWKTVDKVPEVPKDTYTTIDGKKYKVVAKVELKPHYETSSLVQFSDVYDFGVKEDDTPLSFKGTIMLNGVLAEKVNVVGYPNNTTICFKELSHKNKTLTIMKDSVIYYGNQAVVIEKTFNAKWDGKKWTYSDTIPEAPKTEYVTTKDGEKEVIDKISLTPGYTANTLVQFTNVYDFGVPDDNTVLGFEGEIYLDGEKNNIATMIGYKNNTTICLNDISHRNKVLTIKKGAVIYYGNKAIVINETFNMKWNGTTWTEVAEIPQAISDNNAVTVDENNTNTSLLSLITSKTKSLFGKLAMIW